MSKLSYLLLDLESCDNDPYYTQVCAQRLQTWLVEHAKQLDRIVLFLEQVSYGTKKWSGNKTAAKVAAELLERLN
jgi:hypothetical protein